MPFKDKAKKNAYFRKYYSKNKTKLLSRKKNYYLRNRDKILNNAKERWLKAENQIGSQCILCNSKRNLLSHEIYGKEHPSSLYYLIENSKDFVKLCRGCHRALHIVAEPSFNLEKFLELLKILGKTL